MSAETGAALDAHAASAPADSRRRAGRLTRPAVAERMVTIRAPGDVALVECDERAPGAGEVLVRTLYSGVSAGTELTAYRGTNPYVHKRWDAAARLFADGEPTFPYPLDGLGLRAGRRGRGARRRRERGSAAASSSGARGATAARRSFRSSTSRSGRVLPAGVASAPRRVRADRRRRAQRRPRRRRPRRRDRRRLRPGRPRPARDAARAAQRRHRRRRRPAPAPPRAGAGARRATRSSTPRPSSAAEAIRRLTGRPRRGRRDRPDRVRRRRCTRRSAPPRTRRASSSPASSRGRRRGLRLGEEFHHNRIELVSSQIANVPPRLAHRWTTLRLERTVVDLHAAGSARARVAGLARAPRGAGGRGVPPARRAPGRGGTGRARLHMTAVPTSHGGTWQTWRTARRFPTASGPGSASSAAATSCARRTCRRTRSTAARSSASTTCAPRRPPASECRVFRDARRASRRLTTSRSSTSPRIRMPDPS